MLAFGSDRIRDEAILLARLLLVALFLLFGWSKLTDYAATVGLMTREGLPLPSLAALVAIGFEVFVSLALALGVCTRPLAVLMALYTLATAAVGHRYWTMAGPAHVANEINFYKNVSIAGGFLLLYVTGAGRHSIDARLARPGAVAAARPSGSTGAPTR